MSSSENVVNVQESQNQPTSAVDAISDALASVSIQEDSSKSQDSPTSPTHSQNNSESRPFIMYSRSQLLFLHKSPMVKLPTGMPALKDWFGTENDQLNSKKDSEIPAPPSNARDRRFRRDAEDGGSTRPSFRGTAITQPSQMGNFKHQSIRATDRDRDRDADREQDRDKVKEGQERLRNLSDKYDRDRRALSSISQMRPKDRELAPHLSNPSSRVTSQGQQTVSARATDARDPPKKKDGESSEDWRRGTDQPRTGKDRSENGRRDRDDRDRERPRSRVRDSSRPRRDGSPSRRERDDRRTDREDGYSSYRRDERDRDLDRDSEADDPRRWRDDGKRDERIAAKRERENRERDRDRDRRDRPAWDAVDRADRRWVAGEDRDGRGKRPGGRDRKAGDDGKDREDRKDREREREPAWMDTYIPSSSSGGVIGGQRPSGELDGIQAFRKEMQKKDKSSSPSNADVPSEPQARAEAPTQPSESQLDEIQLFKLMMRREEEKKKSDSPLVLNAENPSTGSLDPSSQDHAFGQDTSASLTPLSALSNHGPSQAPSSPLSRHPDESPQTDTKAGSFVFSISSPQPPPAAGFSGHDPDAADKSKLPNSRLYSTPLSSDLPAPQAMAKPSMEALMASNQVSQSHPAAGSRLLALGSRTPQNTIGQSARSTSSQSPVSFAHKNGTIGLNPVVGAGANHNPHLGELPPHFSPATESLRNNNGFSPFEEHRDASSLATSPEAMHRPPLAFSAERSAFAHEQALAEIGLGGGIPNSHSSPSFEPVGSGVAAAKGSRFAKFFDGKGRDNQPIGLGKGGMGNLGPLPPTGPHKMDMGGMLPHNTEARAMEDIFAMLNNSAHAQRLNVAPELANLDVGHYGSPSNNLHALQSPQAHQHVPGHGRLDSLYDSRLDDRNFVPDGMVPGLRSVPPPRSRQNSAMFSDFPEEAMQFNGQRGSAQLYQGPVPSIHLQHGNVGRGGGMPMQLSHYRGGPSPNPLGPGQRLPPGLANLGGRPPHEPNQFVNSSMGMANGGIHGPLHGNGPAQQSFNSYQQPAGLGFGGGPQMRVPHPGAHQLQGTLGHNPLQGLIHPGNLGSSQAQLLGLAGANGVPGGLRAPNGGFAQQGPQVQPPHMAMRQHQQPQQQIPPHMLPLHLQQGFGGGVNNQPAHDLMALLMSGARRD
ncbi:hypothetical protein HYDPIDRAFT_185388 [Hydnomerulius pinastri MD-312]|nr:hypothetical protein HYDPIDRAFT_185388 [Hydnomerulius pinastri MD-312]